MDMLYVTKHVLKIRKIKIFLKKHDWKKMLKLVDFI